MSDPTPNAFAVALASLGARHGSLTALSRRLGLPEATVRRWATGAHLPPPAAWRGLCAALAKAGLREEVPALEAALSAALGAAYAPPSSWVCLTCRAPVAIDADGLCCDCGEEPIEAPNLRAVQMLVELAERLGALEQTSGELCESCGWRARWPSPEGGMPCRLCGSVGGGQ